MATLEKSIVLKPINIQTMQLEIIGDTGLIVHAWSEKAKKEMLEKQQKKKTTKDIRNPKKEYEECFYYLDDGSYGFPAAAIKMAMVNMAHKDKGIEKTLIRKSVRVIGTPNKKGDILLKIKGKPIMREDMVTIGMGSSDLRYRPEFPKWSMQVEIQYNADDILPDTIVNLLEHAGFGSGIGEWRPERNGQYGTFHVKRS